MSLSEGYVYIAASENGFCKTNTYKIGRTKNTSRRISSLNVGISEPLERLTLIRHFLVGDYVKCEKEMHDLYKEQRVTGEFFCLDRLQLYQLLLLLGQREKDNQVRTEREIMTTIKKAMPSYAFNRNFILNQQEVAQSTVETEMHEIMSTLLTERELKFCTFEALWTKYKSSIRDCNATPTTIDEERELQKRKIQVDEKTMPIRSLTELLHLTREHLRFAGDEMNEETIQEAMDGIFTPAEKNRYCAKFCLSRFANTYSNGGWKIPTSWVKKNCADWLDQHTIPSNNSDEFISLKGVHDRMRRENTNATIDKRELKVCMKKWASKKKLRFITRYRPQINGKQVEFCNVILEIRDT